MSIKAIIVDDERHSRETLEKLLDSFCKDISVIKSVDNIKDAIQAINLVKPDVIFLDIELQEGTGFDILTEIDSINFEVIFISAFEHYALKAIKYSSLDYLLKPIDSDELIIAVEKLKRKDNIVYKKQLEALLHNLQHHTKLSKICLATSGGIEFVAIDNIIYCKADGSYTTFYLKNKSTIIVSKHLKVYENLLVDHQFMRIHNRFLINLREVEGYMKSDGGYILMSNQDHLSISNNKKDTFLSVMNQLSF
ncbi:DNA-binding response regulator [Tenacibaculum sp. SZ-18]|uniref:LytR/AlgR family response regulator transcription factor n=1 Tax=Tenacibaculum sp. SZ-18 TaxID=754423 RepID=UPI000C2D0A93|nr:LytTR family DNA-binding domain-containing protein [Tenacibaculum sp. SZ-18]AUC14926.1 DNA-binding response regulator [Tenacibaculum sp. SZ-18]